MQDYPAWMTELFLILADNYEFFSSRMEDELSSQIKYMVWHNIVGNYTRDEIFKVLTAVLRKHQGKAPEPAQYEAMIIEGKQRDKRANEFNKPLNTSGETEEENKKRYLQSMLRIKKMIESNGDNNLITTSFLDSFNS